MTSHRLHVWPWTRRLGTHLVPDWLAIAIGRDIITWRKLSDPELAHELEHVRQWGQHGWTFPLVYLLDSLQAKQAGRRWYRDNRFEIAARAAAAKAKAR